ncbi:MAG TPA: hypothetical protein VK698_21020 [Kofleriaceae bacterium]|nr:hypothetical protein [Kofleriaceae bacterium]
MTSNDSPLAPKAPPDKLLLGPAAARLKGLGLTAGVVCLVIAIVWGVALGDDMRRFFHSYLFAFTYFLSFALGALFYVIIHHLVGATWSVTSRRLAEIVTGAFPALFVIMLGLAVPLLLGSKSLYLWMDHDVVASDHILHAKAGYLNAPFFAIRMLIYFAVWIGLSRYFMKGSVDQDQSGDPAISQRLRARSGPATIAYALTTAWAGFDLLMSLYPHWFSTIFGVYYFAGCAISVYCILALMSFALQRSGRLVSAISVEHYHDMGKMANAFTLFWAYIGFSQFMLIWAANIPEESTFFRPRMFTEWKWMSLALILLHFVVPFVGMMSRHVKRNPPFLAAWAVYMLMVHALDLFWIVMPAYSPDKMVVHPMDFLCLVGVGGLCLFGALAAAGNVKLLAVRDPRLEASLRFVNQ